MFMGNEELIDRVKQALKLAKTAKEEKKTMKDFWDKRPEVDDVEGLYGVTAPVEPIKIYNKMEDDECFVWIEMAIAVVSDPHLAARGANIVRFIKTNKWTSKTANALMVSLGDVFNNGRLEEHPDIVRNQAIISYVAEQWAPIVLAENNKMLMMVDGNHDGENGRRNADRGLAPMEQLIDKLMQYDSEEGKFRYDSVPHAKFGAVTILPFATPDGCDKVPLTFYMTHGSGRNGNVDSEHAKAQAYLSQCGIMADVELSGHHHKNTNSVKVQQQMIKDENDNLIAITDKKTFVASESTLQEDAEYSRMNGFPPADSNVNIYVFRAKVISKKYYSINGKLVDKKVVEVDRPLIIPMFREGSNEYTDFAKRYMEEHCEPDMDVIRREIRRMTKEEIENALKNQRAKYKSTKVPAKTPTSQKDAVIEK